jgi:hypothetical protein
MSAYSADNDGLVSVTLVVSPDNQSRVDARPGPAAGQTILWMAGDEDERVQEVAGGGR